LSAALQIFKKAMREKRDKPPHQDAQFVIKVEKTAGVAPWYAHWPCLGRVGPVILSIFRPKQVSIENNWEAAQ
jgi:hypothetical protein